MASADSRAFPAHFQFGAATAAFQIEGAAFDDGRTASIWDEFCRVPGAVVGGDNGDVACDHYHRYAEDVALMRDLGLNTYRFSTSWARVCPDAGAPNQAGLDFYSRLVDELLGNDVMPWLTLYHWDMPQALEARGGWTVRESAERFHDYAMAVYEELGDRVPVWTTLNEPWCSSFLSYIGGAHAPGRRSVTDGLLASHHLLLGHGLVVDSLRTANPELNVGITLNLTVADPANPDDPADVDAARRIDGQFNRWFADPIFRGQYPADVIEDVAAVDPDAVSAFVAAVMPGDLELISAHIDTLGVNYYHGELVSGSAPAPELSPPPGDAPVSRPTRSPFPAADGVHWLERGLPRTGQNWEVQPEGLTRLLVRIDAEYARDAGTALWVTENGAAYDDEIVIVDGVTRIPDVERREFLRLHLGAVLDAIDAGVDVQGYFYWSLLDNFEWAWGYDKRFGIVHVDFATQQRTLKDSALEYRRIIANRALSPIDSEPGSADND